MGFVSDGWDPAYRPNTEHREANIVNLGYRLLYQEGVKRKRLPPKKILAGSDKSPEFEVPLPEATHEVDPHE